MSQTFFLVIVTLVSAIVSATAVPLAVRLGWRWRAIDYPDQRKHHDNPVPRTGGLAVASGILAGLIAAFALGLFPVGDGGPWKSIPILTATALIFAVGLVDDCRGCSAGFKLAVQVVAAGMVVATGHTITHVFLPFGEPIQFGFAGSIVAGLWLIGITNAINFMDGLDGLAGGLTVIIAICIGVFAALQGAPSIVAVALVVCGACLGFLPFNWRPARIFLGDSGSQMIGFILGCLSLVAALKSSTVVAIIVPLLALGIPAFDALLVVLGRFSQRIHGRRFLQRFSRMFRADRTHLHHHGLLFIGHHQRVVILLYAIVACFCILALAVAVRGNPALATILVLVEVFVVVLIRSMIIHANGRRTRKAIQEPPNHSSA